MGFWRNSSSLIVATRNTTKSVGNIPDYQILSLKRKANAKSFANSLVFPGGVAEKSDADPIWWDYIKSFGFDDTHFQKLSLPGTKSTPIFGEDPLKLHVSLRITAIRETFEELGLFLGRSQKTCVPSSWASNITDFDVKDWQKKVHNDPTEFIKLCQHLNCYPDIWAIHYWSNWLTPSSIKTRFDAAFFVAGLENEPPIYEEEIEVAQARWVNPLAILKEKGVILKPPQVYEFLRLSSKPKLNELIEFATERSPHGTELLFPIMYKAQDGNIGVLPGDTLYPQDPHLFTNTDIYQHQSINELRRNCDHLHRMEVYKPHPRISRTLRSKGSLRRQESKSLEWSSVELKPQLRLAVALRSLSAPPGEGARRLRVFFMGRALLDEPLVAGALHRLKAHLLIDPADTALVSRMLDYPLIVSIRGAARRSSDEARPPMEGEAARYAHFGLRGAAAERALPDVFHCCLDLAPLLVGDHGKLSVCSRLEPAAARGALEAVSWCNLPLLRCELTLERPPAAAGLAPRPRNLVRLTARAAARLWPREPGDPLALTVALPADVEEGVENVTFSEPSFGRGWSMNDGLKWENHKVILGHSLYMKDDQPTDLYNPSGIHYEEYLEQNSSVAAECARWNAMRRRALSGDGALAAPGRRWLAELRAPGRRAVAFLDFSRLLLPNYKRVLVVAPLLECGEETPDALDEVDPSALRPLLDGGGAPAFLVVEIELLHPLNPARPHHDVTIERSEVEALMRSRTAAAASAARRGRALVGGAGGRAPVGGAGGFAPVGVAGGRAPVGVAGGRALLRLAGCARRIVEDEYRLFLVRRDEAPHTSHHETLMAKFGRFLCQNRAFVALRSSLMERAAELTRGPDPRDAGHEMACVRAHVSLARAAQAALGARRPARAGLRDAHFAAAQADRRLADAIFMQHLSANPHDERTWLRYALCQAECGEVERAVCCLQEALLIRPRDKYATLLLATLWTRGAATARDAERLLCALLRLHPTWRFAWLALFCHYKRTDRFRDAELALDVAKGMHHQSVSEELIAVGDILFYCEDIPPARIFLQGAALFLHLRDYEFAELCLAEELEMFGNGLHYEYLAIGCCLLRNHIAAAFSRVARALKHFGHTWRLLLLESECAERAAAATGRAAPLSSGGDARAPALLQLRRARALRGAGAQPARALALARSAADRGPLHAWLELAEHCADAGQLEEAEACLAQAASRAPFAPEPWAALAALHARRAHRRQAALCARRARRLGHCQESVPKEMMIKCERPLWEPVDCSPHSCRCEVESLNEFLCSISPI